MIAGMGELHLEIYVERIRREYKRRGRSRRAEGQLPRSADARPSRYDFKHKKQTGGSGQYAHIVGTDGPDDRRRSGRDRRRAAVRRQGHRRPHSEELHPGRRKGLPQHAGQGPARRLPGRRLKIELEDGKYHDVDSSDMAFMICAQELLPRDVPEDEAGAAGADHDGGDRSARARSKAAVVGNITSRRGIVIVDRDERRHRARSSPKCRWPKRSATRPTCAAMTQGQGTFTMEFAKYRPVPTNIQTEIIAERKAELQPA